MSSLLSKEAIEVIKKVDLKGFYNHLFVVPKASGGWRPVLNVSVLNVFIEKTKFNMETIHSVLASIRQGD